MGSYSKWYLYVLRYKYSGNYYVGITPNLEKRMGIHFRRTSENPKRLPQWSQVNKSIKGFKCFWFELLDTHGNTDSSASLIENKVGFAIEKRVNEIQNDNQHYFVNWGQLAKSQFPDVNPISQSVIQNDPIVKQIEDFILNLHISEKGNIPIHFMAEKEY